MASLAKDIEGEGTATRYGIIEDGKLITPEDKYKKTEADNFLINLKEIFKEIPNLEEEKTKISEYIEKCEDLIINESK